MALPRLGELLQEVLLQIHAFDNSEIQHDFESIGRKKMLLNGGRVSKPGDRSQLILLGVG